MWAVCGIGRQLSALSTDMAFEQTARDDGWRIASGVCAAHGHLRQCLPAIIMCRLSSRHTWYVLQPQLAYYHYVACIILLGCLSVFTDSLRSLQSVNYPFSLYAIAVLYHMPVINFITTKENAEMQNHLYDYNTHDYI